MYYTSHVLGRRGSIAPSGNQAGPHKNELPLEFGLNACKYCRADDLSNEASVESFFVLRLLKDLGYRDSEIKPKKAITTLAVARGRETESYTPDYLIVCGRKARWLVETKAVSESLDKWAYQGAGYAFLLNRKADDAPCKYFMLTKGLLTRVYEWDKETPLLSLRLTDFVDGNPKFESLKGLLGADAARRGWRSLAQAVQGHRLVRPSMDEVKRAFARCHRRIWKSEKMSRQAAFIEFAKLLFVKLWEDRKLRGDSALLSLITNGEPVPRDQVRFSSHWITAQESNDPNPINSILFRQLVDKLEDEISKQRRKRIFEPDEKLRSSPGTIKEVVKQLEGYYLFGIDEDLNGRMFETFLTATMRGQELGQYFTPRSIVKLIITLARPEASRGRIDRVLDACCGTGGFLIEALTVMRKQVWDNTSLRVPERSELLDRVANEAIFGIDAGVDPPVARIARINMYLHGDGGSRVYMTDALRKKPQSSSADSRETRQEVEELRDRLEKGAGFDIVVTNPPFSMDYSDKVPSEREVLEDYDLKNYGGKSRTSLRSSIMFVERYWQLLKPGGMLLTVIDDSVLGGKTYSFARSFIRERFVIRAVISLPGDAFQRAGARAKTSILVLQKRLAEDSQPDVFVYECRYVGLDDVVPRTPKSVAERARQDALDEIAEVAESYNCYLRGQSGSWLVSAEKIGGRLDAKHLRPWSVSQIESRWVEAGAKSARLDELVEHIEAPYTIEPDREYTFLNVTYSGCAKYGERRLGREIRYDKVYAAKAGDIVVSNIGAVYKAVCVLPEEMESCITTSEFTVMRLKPGVSVDTYYLWSVLRSSAVIAECLSRASGLGRHRVDWSILSEQRVPLLPEKEQGRIGDSLRAAIEHEKSISKCLDEASRAMAKLELDGELAEDRLARAKPPR